MDELGKRRGNQAARLALPVGVRLDGSAQLHDGRTDVVALATASCRGPIRHLAVDLGRQHGALSSLSTGGEPRAQNPLGTTLASVNIGGVEVVDAVLVGGVQDRVRVALVGVLRCPSSLLRKARL
jgi:hypothetical protein